MQGRTAMPIDEGFISQSFNPSISLAEPVDCLTDSHFFFPIL